MLSNTNSLYLIVDADEISLPRFCRTPKECMAWLGCKSRSLFYDRVWNHRVVKHKYYIEKPGVTIRKNEDHKIQ